MKRKFRNAKHLFKKTLAMVLTLALFFSLAVQDAGIGAFAAESNNIQDVPLDQMTATASSVNPYGEPSPIPELAINDSPYDQWRSHGGIEPLPDDHPWFKINLGATYNVAQIRYYEGYNEGHITEHEIWVSKDDKKYTKVNESTWETKKDSWEKEDSWTKDDFTPTEAQYVKLVILAATKINDDGTIVSFPDAAIAELRIGYEAGAEAQLTGIAVSSPPTKTQYALGEELNSEGLAVTAQYSDGSTRDLQAGEYTLSGFDSDTAGTKTVTVTYEGQTAGFDVTVSESSVYPQGRVTVLTPDYRSEISGDTTVEFVCPGAETARVTSQQQPEDVSEIDTNGTCADLGTLTLDAEGNGSFVFQADNFPKGPVSLRIEALDGGGNSIDNAYLQLYNTGGAEWKTGLENAPVNPVTQGMEKTFSDDFNTMPSITVDGIGADYASRKVDVAKGGMFGWAAFEDFDGPYNPFSIVDNEYMKLTTTYRPDYSRDDYWGQKVTTGYLSSMAQDGGGFHTKGGTNQYFEARIFCGPNPGLWPAFWTLTANGYAQNPDPGQSDELDILEGYMGTPSGYQIAWHQWDYDTGLGGGANPNLETEAFSHINLAMGFHTFAVLITQQTTHYYCDNIEVASHKTLPNSWEDGNYFIINAALSDHYGIDTGDEEDPFKNFRTPFGFTRYGDECDTYVDWVRVYEDAPGTPRFETASSAVSAAPGQMVRIPISRNEEAQALSGSYELSMPENWKVVLNDEIADADEVAFEEDSAEDVLTFLVPEDYDDPDGTVIITPVTSNGERLNALVIQAKAPDSEGTLVRVDGSTYPYRSLTGGTSGAWKDYDPSTHEETYFTVESGNWWNEGWSWMHDRVSNNGKISFKFTGVSAAVYPIMWDGGGTIRIYLDGEEKTTFDTYSATERSDVAAFQESGLEMAEHTLTVETVGDAGGDDNRIAAFEYRYQEDVHSPKFTADVTTVDAAPGGQISIDILRNSAALTTAGEYEITFPGDGWQIVSGQTFTTNHPVDTIVLQVPEGYDDFAGKIKITPVIGTQRLFTMTVIAKGPSSPEAPPLNVTGELQRVDAETYPFVNAETGETSGSWLNFDAASQPERYFNFHDCNWWSDGWGYMYLQTGDNQKLTFTFEGVGVSVYGLRFDTGASFDVYLDGEFKETVKTQGSNQTARLFTLEGLSSTVHELELRILAGSGSHVNLSAFEYDYVKSTEPRWIHLNSDTYPYQNVGDPDNPDAGAWSSYNNPNGPQDPAFHFDFSLGGAWWSDSWGWMYANGTDSTLDFTFEGTAVTLEAIRGDYGGKAEIYLDGVLQTTVDTYSETDQTATIFEKDGLQAAEHTLRFKNLDSTTVRFSGFSYLFTPATGDIPRFTAENATVEAVPGGDLILGVRRSEEAQALSGTYEIVFPGDGWSVESGASFAAGSALDSITLNVPEDYSDKTGRITVTPVDVDGDRFAPIVFTAQTPTLPPDDIITLLSPDYEAEIEGETTLNFTFPGGYATAEAFSLLASSGDVGSLGAPVTLDAQGGGTIAFDADLLPHGPVTVRVIGTKSDGVTKSIDNYLAFYNKGGQNAGSGLDNAPMPSQIQNMGMEQIFADDFRTMPTISREGLDQNGAKTTYISHKPDFKDYGGAQFADYEGTHNPFSQKDDYLQITTARDENLTDPYGRKYYTGFLASVDKNGNGIKTDGYVNQYFEARFYTDAHPGLWPAFWTLSNQENLGSDEPCDELDVIEGYMAWPDRYSIAAHAWGNDHPQSGINLGTSVKAEEQYGQKGNITMGFHTYGVLITEETTYYYFDNQQVYQHPTLTYSWTKGNYFMINNALSDHSFPEGYGFERYGEESHMYVDWVRVYQQPVDPNAVRFTTDTRVHQVQPGDTLSVAIDRSAGAQALSGHYDVQLPDGWTLTSGSAFEAGAASDTLTFHVSEDSVTYNSEIRITPVSGETSYKTISVKAQTETPFEAEVCPVLNNAGTGWEVAVKLTNGDETASVPAGYIEVTGPEAAAGQYPFREIPAGGSTVIRLPGSVLKLYELTPYDFTVVREDGYEREFERTVNNLTAVKAALPITIDGVVDSEEWAGAVPIVLGENAATNYSAGRPWKGEDDCSAIGRVKWDDENLYLSVVVKDDIHFQESDVLSSWGSDSMQFSIDPGRTAGYTGGGTRFIAAVNSRDGSGGLALEDKGILPENPATDRCVNKRDEAAKTTTYEIALKWSDILPAGQQPKVGTADGIGTDIGFAFLINDNDGDASGRVGWLSYMGGIGLGKHAEEFGDLILTDKTFLDTTPAAASVTVTVPDTTFKAGETASADAVVNDQYGQPMEGADVVWESSDETVATVDEYGVITAIAAGTATITATSGGVSGDIDITVSGPEEPILYTLNILAGTGGSISVGTSGRYAAGAEISLNAAARSNYKFSRWTSVGGGTFADADSASTVFTMPASDVSVTAIFTYTGGGSGTKTAPVESNSTTTITQQNGGTTMTVTTVPDAAPTVSDGKASFGVTVPESAFQAAAGTAQKLTQIVVTAPTSALVNALKDPAVQKVQMTLTAPSEIAYAMADRAQVRIGLEAAVLEAAKQAEKDVIVSVKDALTGVLAYSWTFQGGTLADSGEELKGLDLALNVKTSSLDPAVSRALPASERGALLTFAANEILPAPATVRVRLSNQGFLPGQTAYLYSYNSETGKLEILENSAYIVDQDGYASIVIDHTSQYVLLKKQVPAVQPVKLDTGSRLTVKAGRTYQFKVTASVKPTFVCGNGSVFRVVSVFQKGGDYFFKFAAAGKPGDSAGFYLNGEKAPRTIGTVA